jgi:hypothetical protein
MSSFLLRLALVSLLVGLTHGLSSSSSSCQCGAPYERSIDDSLLAAAVAVRIDAGIELTLDQYPLHLDPEEARTSNQYRYFRAIVYRVFVGCEELETKEQVIVSVPKDACTMEKGIIAADGTLSLDLLFGTISSMTFPSEGTTQVLEVDPCQANATVGNVSTETRETLGDYGSICDQAAAYPQNLRGSSVDRQ